MIKLIAFLNNNIGTKVINLLDKKLYINFHVFKANVDEKINIISLFILLKFK